MSLELTNPEATVTQAIEFIRCVFREQKKTIAVIAVSGGIDSAVALTLLTRALGPVNVHAVWLPHHTQDMTDAHRVVEFNHLPLANRHDINIFEMASAISQTLGVSDADQVRKGNIKARCRMIVVYDLAKKYDALVCGTENKSEHYLGYFTRFGDAAADVEPISHWYKTQVRQVGEFLQVPVEILQKAPSAGLWPGQTDEAELGFSYDLADQVLLEVIDKGVSPEKVKVEGVDQSTIKKVIAQLEKMRYKRVVPYVINEHVAKNRS